MWIDKSDLSALNGQQRNTTGVKHAQWDGQMVQRRQRFWIHTARWGGADAFAHFSAITMEGFKSLKEGSRVSFELAEGPKGPMAVNIRDAEPPAT